MKHRIISPKVNAVLDRTNTSVRKASMITASVLNTAGIPASTVSLSKSSIHRRRQKQRLKSAQEIRQGFSTTKSVVHWDGKLLPDTDESTQLVNNGPGYYSIAKKNNFPCRKFRPPQSFESFLPMALTMGQNRKYTSIHTKHEIYSAVTSSSISKLRCTSHSRSDWNNCPLY